MPKKVKDFWWSDKDLNVIDEDGVHIIYKDAYFSAYESNLESTAVYTDQVMLKYSDVETKPDKEKEEEN